MAAATHPSSDVLVERIFLSTVHTLELLNIYLGKKLGLYEVLADRPDCSAAELAAAARIHERYAQEWLEQQATAGFLALQPPIRPEACSDPRRFALPDPHRRVLTDLDSPMHVAPFAEMIAGVAQALPEVVKAFRSGGGVPFARYGADLRQGQCNINRPAFRHDLTGAWIPALEDVHQRLESETGLCILDLGCGQGWSTLALAAAYPQHRVLGIDLDQASIAVARQQASAQASSAEFRCADAASVAELGPIDFALIIESLHDMSQPQEVLGAVRSALRAEGVLLVADERVAEEFHPDGDALERMMYGWSTLHCLPVSMVDASSRALGTVLRPSTLRALADEAGFASCLTLPLQNDLFRFYRLEGLKEQRP